MKKGPLSKKEKRIIEQDYKDHSVATISQKLDRSIHMIEKHIMKMGFTREEPKKDGGASGGKAPTSGELFARNKERGVTIMTKEASMAADDNKGLRKEAANGHNSERYSRFLHIIKEDK